MHKLTALKNRITKEKDYGFKKNLVLALKIAREVKKQGGKTLAIGGYVRDEILAKRKKVEPSKDLDLEIYGLTENKLKYLLLKFGKVNLVGQSFSVYKVGELDIALPRKDVKTGRGHKGFIVEYDRNLDFYTASNRRDFTINALGMDLLTGELLDEHGGIKDLNNRLIRAVDYKTFGEDPLRVLRAAQLASRLGFNIENKTIEICRKINLKELPWERIGEEIKKILLKSAKPSVGFNYALKLNIIDKLFPELKSLIGLKQDKLWHPEGDVWNHNLIVIDEAAKIIRKNKITGERAETLIWAALTHDLGKITTTKTDDNGRIISPNHAMAGITMAKKLLKKLKVNENIISKVLPIIKEHINPAFVNEEYGESAVRRLAKRLYPAVIQELLYVAEADHRGTGKKWDGFPGAKMLQKKAKALELNEKKPKPIFLGRHLLQMGFLPDKQEKLFGKVIRTVNEAELDGIVTNLKQAKYYGLKTANKLRLSR